MDATINPSQLDILLSGGCPPALLDVRTAADQSAEPRTLPMARRVTPDDLDRAAAEFEPWRLHLVFCAHGGERSRSFAAGLRARGIDAVQLENGLAAWQAAQRPLQPPRPATRWVTRARPKIDRIACPWLIRRFIDPAAEFLFVPTDEVFATAEREQATAFDIPGAEYSHQGESCSFDYFIARHALAAPGLDTLARIVRGADTARLDLAPEAAGLLAVSLGLSRLLADDQAMLRHGLLVYDALYAWCVEARDETHNWKPSAAAPAAA